MKCIIKEKRIKGPRITDQARRIAHLTGQGPLKAQKSVRYQNAETREEYLCLWGGFAWPGLKPGFAVVVAVLEPERGKGLIFKVLEEVEENDINALLRGAFDLFQKYGKNCSVIPWQWFGDPESGFNEFLHRFNKHLEKAEDRHWLCLSYPPHFKEANRFGIYCQTIHLLSPKSVPSDMHDQKRLSLGSCKRLQSYLTQLNHEAVHKGTPQDHPAVAALGYALSALYEYEPWLRDVETFDRDREDYETNTIKEQSWTFNDLGLEDYDFGDQEQFDDGALKSTIQEK